MGERTSREGRRLLIVDDEELILRALSRALQHEYVVMTVTSPEEALRLVTFGESWDVVLSDVTMPVMSGIELASRLVQACPALVGRIVLMTGGAYTPRAQSELERCGLPWVLKPIDVADLLLVLSKVR